MVVMSDTDDPFVPLPDDLLVNLTESRGVVEALLDSLPTTFSSNAQVSTQPASDLSVITKIGNVPSKACRYGCEPDTWCAGAACMSCLSRRRHSRSGMYTISRALSSSSFTHAAWPARASRELIHPVRVSPVQTDSATGPALQAAFMVMGSIGGKLLLFQAASPSVGVGRIKARDLPTLYGTDRHGIFAGYRGPCALRVVSWHT